MADREPNPLVDQIRKGGVPLEVRMMAAEGALPLKPEDLVDLLEVMHRDPLPEVSTLATKTFSELAADTLLPLVKARDATLAVLSWALEVRTDAKVLEACLQNTSTPDEAIALQAPRLPEALAELVVINQTRLLRHPPLLERIESNPMLSRDQRRRLGELRETFSIGVTPEPEAPPPAQAPPLPPPPPPPPPPPVEAPPPTPVEEAAAVDENTIELKPEEAEAILTEDEKKDEKAKSNLARLFSLKTGQKIKAALTEDAQTRGFLIRDPNRLVSLAVLGSPKITEAEIEGIAGMKNVSDEVLRRIGTNRDWTKKYTVINSLVKNPRTPLPIAMGFVSRLQPRDIKALTVDRNVPEAIRKAAQRFVKAQVQKGTKE
jgi:outer membrane biosynthesis protein TonB